MKPRTILAALTIIATALAGCAEESDDAAPSAGVLDPDEVILAAGTGAIQGLLIDDRFRPLAAGLILMQPLGLTAMSNENGEFQFLDIEPGTYTIRVTIDGHEAAPQRVTVKATEFTEAQVVARRVVNEGGTVLTREFSVFVPCAADFLVNGIVWDCTLDQSGDTYRPGFSANYTGMDGITYLVAEMKSNQVGNYDLQLRHDDGTPAGAERWAVAKVVDDDYVKIVLKLGEANTEHNEQSNNVPWNNTVPVYTIMFMAGEYREEVDSTLPKPCPAPGTTGTGCSYRGLGAQQGIRATFIHSLFIGEPEVDIATYCVLC